MSSAWLLPEHIADVLPLQAQHIEHLRRVLLDVAASYGYELIIPPLLEYVESLLSGAGTEMNLLTFKLVDQLSGRTMGVRADTTPQAARIDAHLLNRQGVTRLCYCGPILHTLSTGLHANREPLQFGAEIYGYAGLEADVEAIELALTGLARIGLQDVVLDLADVRILQGILDGVALTEHELAALIAALAAKDSVAIQDFSAVIPQDKLRALEVLTKLYGSAADLVSARQALSNLHPLIDAAFSDLAWLVQQVRKNFSEVRLNFDLADLNGYAYYTGIRFSIYTEGYSDRLVRGGRYDAIGAIFGRDRPAVGFSLDLKALKECLPPCSSRLAIRAPWVEDDALKQAVKNLRQQGEIVVSVFPGQQEVQAPSCDREMLYINGQWVVSPL